MLGVIESNGTEKNHCGVFAAINIDIHGTQTWERNPGLDSCVGAIVTTIERMKEFKSYLEEHGFEVKAGDRIDSCPVCGNEGSASLKDGKIKCFRVGCELNDKGLLSLERYIEEFDKIGAPRPSSNKDQKRTKSKKTVKSEPEVDVDKNHEIYSEAVEYFQKELFSRSKQLKYLTETRGRTEESIKHFEVGLVADSDRLYNRLEHRYSVEEIEASGLYRYDGMEMVCTLPYGAYTYPIWWDGKIRTIKYKGEGKNGYIAKKFTGNDYCSFLNSDALQEEEIILVEGENDVMRLWEMGKRNTVAVLGSLSRDQLSHLISLAGQRTIYLCYDNDEAGEEYVRKSVATLIENKLMTLKIITYSGADPDVGKDFNWEGIPVDHIVQELEEIEAMRLDEESSFFTDRYVKVEVGSKIIYANKKYRNQWLESRALSEKHGDRRNALKYWKNFKAELAERGVCCDFTTTDHIVDDRFNMFEGFAIAPAESNLPVKWLGFVKEVICDGNSEYYEYIMDWLSDLCQNPNEQTSVVPVIISKQGAGKNLFVSPIQKIIGKRYATRVDDIESIIGTYNGIIENKLFINLDEATFGRSKREKNRFKSLTGNPSITINVKYRPVYEADFSCRFIVTSNELAPVAVESDNRRYFVLEAGNHRIGQRDYYTDLWKEISDEKKLSALYHYLLHRTISADYNRTYVKHTKFEQSMRNETLDSVGTWLNEVEEGLASSLENWKEKVSDNQIKLKDLYDCYDLWFDNNRDSMKYNEKFTVIGFGKILRTTYWRDVEYSTFRFKSGVTGKGFKLNSGEKGYDDSDWDEYERQLMLEIGD